MSGVAAPAFGTVAAGGIVRLLFAVVSLRQFKKADGLVGHNSYNVFVNE
jgi:hypothetical protein